MALSDFLLPYHAVKKALLLPAPDGHPHFTGTNLSAADSEAQGSGLRAQGFHRYGFFTFASQKCLDCGHSPCPCCKTWCDHHDCILKADGCEGECRYEAPPTTVSVDLQWIGTVLAFLHHNGWWRKGDSPARIWRDNWDPHNRFAMIAEPHRLFAPGDIVIAQFSNGGGERQPACGWSSKLNKPVYYYYMKYGAYPGSGNGPRIKYAVGPMMLLDVPEGVTNALSRSPLLPGLTELARAARARLPAQEPSPDLGASRVEG